MFIYEDFIDTENSTEITDENINNSNIYVKA